MKSHLAVRFALAACLVLVLGTLTVSGAAEKIKITKLDDLPRYTYKIDGKAVDFLNKDAAVMKLADEVKRDLEKDLATYDIPDKRTVQGYYKSLGKVALLEGNYDTYFDYLKKCRDLEDKDASRLTMGLFVEAWVKAKKMGDAHFNANLKSELAKLVMPLPYDMVEANIKKEKGFSEIVSVNVMLGAVESIIQPLLDKSGGEISRDVAVDLLSSAINSRIFIPNKQAMTEVYSAYLDAHKVVKSDIWATREVDLSNAKDLKPVVLAIWDTGVDTAIFVPKKQMWTNTKEIQNNNMDDDKNGFVDDVYGIAWSLHSDKEIPMLFNVGDISTDRPLLQKRLKGFTDLQENIDSPEAQELRQNLSTIEKDSVKPFFEGLGKYSNYCHGTHVSGIAAKNNPAARLLAARLTFDYHLIPELPTIEQAEKDVRAMDETIDYFKKNGARVVNMSWGGSLRDVENALEQHNAGGTPEERKALARKIFNIQHKGLFDAIKNAPDILFVVSAGNANSDVVFEEFFPSSFDLPNMLSVGAVDQAGDETSFTSFGKVDIYGNGFEVMSYVPGGDELKLSGTSMSSPGVTNLAGKLLAKKPNLTVAQLRHLILDSADKKQAGERTVKLMNPKRSMEMLAKMK